MTTKNPLRAYRPPQVPKFGKLVSTLPGIAREVAEYEVELFARQELYLFQTKIRAQKFRSFLAFPLSERWLARKWAAGADERTMIATEHYLRSMRVFRYDVDGKIVFHVGFARNARAMDLNGRPVEIMLNDVAWIQEKGSHAAHIPARPHWKPHRDTMAKKSGALRAKIKASIVSQLRAVFPSWS